mmetsp:Transcript_21748/g.66609  ORF Transcript_21748/g.66609 Transcript_21748/m.66609 type:complete len:194 (-) Transcript_21748:147-728(-)|eukprot:CAMPEP_0118861246 /NCGR_PEP_ID=MMETSP1163-20130328/6842_1 /TAXON_ID=124430 /ORGANISM="Phaeomonas parva, Strain CCMP2877" /LENGTH=193 /DNA_ID=CAMNT_0006795045 /DNA_START=90 /DNA_END=671 /DNA_ORIENTATION=-
MSNAEGDKTETHALHRRWAWWCWWQDKSAAGAEWEQNLLKVLEFGTVEEFWALFESMAPATRLNERMKANYAVLKDTSRPTWEDCEENDGGDWELCISTNDNAMNRLDEWWLKCLLALIGETFDEESGSDEVLGVYVSRRPRETRLYVRTRNADDETTQLKLGQIMRTHCDIPSYLNIEYKRPSARKNTLYSV